ncbi:MAG: CinA family nicotinamide mononucleotide deamidase-related protein [Planctomycetota bacterium]|nr:MAG: CinA family nicotinamide mononucleotide deamidase-related protein [Planctomycetota bacterium]
MIPRAVILAIGDELLLGRTQDTNTAYLARWCQDHGIRVVRSAILGDDEAQMVAAMAAAAAEADLVLITGGLGPTRDDRTRHALAAAAGVPLRQSASAWKQIQAYYGRVRPGEAVPESNRRQALTPRGAQLLRNDRGTAPGLAVAVAESWLVALPGVPVEMYAMLERLAPRLATWFPQHRIPVVQELHLCGLGESAVQDQLGDLLEGDGRLSVGITAHEAGHITIRVVGSASAGRRRLAACAALLGPWVLPEAGVVPSLVHVLRRRGLTISAAESCTCGQVAALLGAVPGVSAVLEESLITYANQAKIRYLGVSDWLIEQNGVVSEACAQAMAEGMRLRSGADLAVATTGIAGPDGGTRAKPVGSVWIAVASRQGLSTRCLQLHGDRQRIQRRAAIAALRLAWEHVRRPARTPNP